MRFIAKYFLFVTGFVVCGMALNATPLAATDLNTAKPFLSINSSNLLTWLELDVDQMSPHLEAARSEGYLPDQIDKFWVDELAGGRTPNQYCSALRQITSDIRPRLSGFVLRLNNEIQKASPGSPVIRAFRDEQQAFAREADPSEMDKQIGLWVGDAKTRTYTPDRLAMHFKVASALSVALDDLSRHSEQARLSCVTREASLWPASVKETLQECRASPGTVHSSVVRRLVEAGVRSITLTCYRVAIDIDNLALNYLLLDRVDISMFSAESISAGSLVVRNSHFENCRSGTCYDFYLPRAVFSGDFRIEQSKLVGQLRASGITVEGSTTIERSEFVGVDDFDAVSGYEAKLRGGLSITDSQFDGGVFFGKIDASELRFAGNHIDGRLSLWGARITGPSFFGHSGTSSRTPGNTILGSIEAYYFEGDDFQFDSNLVKDQIELSQSKFDGRLWMNNSIFGGNLLLENMRANTVVLAGVSASNVNLNGADVAANVTISRVVTKTLSYSGARAGSLDIDGETTAADWTALAKEAGERREVPLGPCRTKSQILSDPDYPGISSGMSLGVRIHPDNRVGCSDRVSLSGSYIGGVAKIGGIVRHAVDLDYLTVGSTVYLGGDIASFGPKACISANGLKTDTLVADTPDLTSPGELTLVRAPQFIELNASAIRVIRPADSLERDSDVSRVMSMFLRSPSDRCDKKEGLKGLGPNPEQPLPPTYAPAVFDAVASGYQAAGYSDIAREIRIEKNRAYSSSLVPDWNNPSAAAEVIATQFIYSLADWLNGFGFKNLKGVFWILGIVSFGVFLGWIGERRLQRWTWPVRNLRHISTFWWKSLVANLSPFASPKLPTLVDYVGERERQGIVKGPEGPILLFSLDRAIPSLGLDQEFGSHRQNVAGILSAWFYVQRVMCFGIIVLMLAGTFGVFQ